MQPTSWLSRISKISPRTETGLQDGGANISYTGESSGVGGMFTVPEKRKNRYVNKKIKPKTDKRQGEPEIKKMLQVR